MSLSKDQVDRIVGRIASNDSTLTYVNLKNKGLGDDECAKIAQALRANTALIRLYLSSNDIGDAGAAALASALTVNSTLAELGMLGNDVGDAGAASLAEALAAAAAADNNSALTHLDLSRNRIGDAGAIALAGMLASDNSALAVLGLEHNRIKVDGVIALAESLLGNSTLAELHLDDNEAFEDEDNDDDDDDAVEDAERRIEELLEINYDADSPEEAGRLKVEWRIRRSLEDSENKSLEYEAAANLALDELGRFPESSRRRELFELLLGGSSERGEEVASSVDISGGRALYRYAVECGASPGALMNVLRAHPSLCGTCRDTRHKLYPFMLLATVAEAGVGDVMELLLRSPSLVETGISGALGCRKRTREQVSK